MFSELSVPRFLAFEIPAGVMPITFAVIPSCPVFSFAISR
ncbi:hypothetical protein [Phage toucan80]|nr:hypothetical protein [Phage toucan80]